MRYDRDVGYRRRGREVGEWAGRGEWLGRGEYGEWYEAPTEAHFHGYGMGYAGGALRSRGSFEAGQLRSGLNPVDEFEFEWGEGYVGGRGYGGTNYDIEHGYQVGGIPRYAAPEPPAPRAHPSLATRAGYSWSEYAAEQELYGPARYGYGPYYERLRRRRRSDDEIRRDVEDTLFYDTWVDADRIEVRVEGGIVTLSGTLRSYDEVRYATDDAWDVDGVRGVRSELQVREERGAGAGGRGLVRPGAAPRPRAEAEAEAPAPVIAEAGGEPARGAGAAARTPASRARRRARGPEAGSPEAEGPQPESPQPES